MNANIAAETLQAYQRLAAAQTDALTSKLGGFKVTAGGSRHFRYDIYVGKVAATATAKLQQSSGFNLWSDTKTVSITASTEKTISGESTSADTLTVTAHGYTEGQPVSADANGGTLSGGLEPGKVYYVHVVDANTIQVSLSNGGTVVDITAASAGTPQLSAVRVFSITFLAEVAGDQAYVPLKQLMRLVTTTGAGICTVLSARSVQEE